jgi:hypothetical protein
LGPCYLANASFSLGDQRRFFCWRLGHQAVTLQKMQSTIPLARKTAVPTREQI